MSGKVPLWIAVGALLFASSAGAETPRRVVVIAIDAVPYSLVADLTDAEAEEPLFQGFKGPVPLISTFPATTSLAMAAILHPFGLEISPGYEAKYFDHEKNRIRGGGPISYRRITFPWREFFDWKVHSVFRKMTSALHPVRSGEAAVERSLAKFIESDKMAFFVYYDATDLIGHLKGPDSLVPVLQKLDQQLRDLKERYPERPFVTVLFSDHGMTGGAPMVNVRGKVEKALKQAGFHLAAHLRKDRDVVFAPFGLVSSFVAFTAHGQEVPVASAMVTVDGVDLCAAPQDGGWRVVSGQGQAMIRRRSDASSTVWSYEPNGGDPLRLAPVVERLRQRDRGSGDWFPDRWWFEESRSAYYPDALYRIASGFHLVENPASVVCSLSPGYMYGATMTNFWSQVSVGRLRWTHGALYDGSSLGFLMSDAPGWEPPAFARFGEGLAPFVSLTRSEKAVEVQLAEPWP